MQYWKRIVGDITVAIEEDMTDYLTVLIEGDSILVGDFQVTRHDLQRMIDEIQGYLDGN